MKYALLLCVLFCGGLRVAVADDTYPKSDALPKVVVEQFVNKTEADPQLFSTLKSRIENEIINTRKFTYLERGEKLKNAMAERGRIASNLVSNEKALPEGKPAVPKLKAAGYSIYGEILFLGLNQTSTTVAKLSVSRLTAKVELLLRLSDIETGEVLVSKIISAHRSTTRSAVRASGGNMTTEGNLWEQGMNEAIATAAQKVVTALMDLAYPTKVLAVNVPRETITVNLTRERTKVDKLYDIFSSGEELIDPDTEESLGVNENYVGRAKVIRTFPKVAQLTPVGDLEISSIKKGMILREVDEATLLRESREAKAAARRKFRSRF